MMGKNLSVFCIILCTLFALSSNVSCTPELIADILATPIREIRASFTPESKPGLAPDIFPEIATGMRSFLGDIKQVTAAVDEAIKNSLKENDRQNLVGFRESLEMAYKKTEDLYNRFQSVLEESKLEPATREDKLKPATSMLAAKQNIANAILQLKDEAVRNVNDSLMLGVKRSSFTSPNEEEDTEIKRDVTNNDASEVKAADSNNNELENASSGGGIVYEFLTNPSLGDVFSEWSDAMKNLRQKSWSNISGFTDALYREKSELLNNPKVLLVNPNEGIDGLNVLSILRNVTEPITKLSVHSGSADWGDKKNRRNLFRTTRTSSSTKDSNDSVELNSVLPTNYFKKATEQAVNTSRDSLSKASATAQATPLGSVEGTLQFLSQKLKKILPDAAVPK